MTLSRDGIRQRDSFELSSLGEHVASGNWQECPWCEPSDEDRRLTSCSVEHCCKRLSKLAGTPTNVALPQSNFDSTRATTGAHQRRLESKIKTSRNVEVNLSSSAYS